MIQLSYQPAFDPLHATFRLLRLREIIRRTGSLQVATIRILDFFLLFPFRLNEVRFTPQHGKYRRLARTYATSKPYGDQPPARELFERMEVMQIAALQTLCSKGFLRMPAPTGGVEATESGLSDSLLARIREANESEQPLMECLSTLATQYSLTGEDGLKARTHLMEYRYDAI